MGREDLLADGQLGVHLGAGRTREEGRGAGLVSVCEEKLGLV